ncbi:MAG: 16S rRNA (uracil(1498)-N(3))-methyltransferase [Proteobacteria bacterium]|nr:16S rRNA (uracil(1498)-N(3))-methyltransferase [Pseudomonadota bacterium]
MHIPRLYLDKTIEVGQIISLPTEKSHHLSKVLRMHKQDAVILFNNSGSEFNGALTEITDKTAKVKVTNCTNIDRESPIVLTLALAISRGQPMDYSIQKAVELGVNHIVPIFTEYSNVKKKEALSEKKLVHWRNIIISAAEQSGRTRLPSLAHPKNFGDWLIEDASLNKCIMHPGGEKTLNNLSVSGNELAIIIGPEGGFSDAEVDYAREHSCMQFSLGPRILRLETAVVTGLSLIQFCCGDLK